MNFGGDHSAPGHGKVSPRCVPKLPTVARYRPDAFPKGPRTGKAPVRGNISPACIQIQLILARYARHASEKPRKAPLGNTPREHLAALRWPCPCAGAPARAAASRDRLSTAWPLRRDACPSAPPMPATCQYPPLAVPVAARDKPPMSFGGGRPAHGLQSGRAPRGRRPHHLDGQADNEMLRRTGPELQNREQVGAEPAAEAAGPASPAPALPKTPIERTSPSWRRYRNTPPLKRCISANSAACAFASAHKGRIRQNTYHRLGNTSLKHDAPPSPARTNRYRFSAERRWQPNLQA